MEYNKMDSNKLQIKELLDLKFKVMIKKIDKLYLICKILFDNFEAKGDKSLEIVKEQYIQTYNKLIEADQYEKYRDVEDIIIKEIAKIELSIDQYVYNTIQSYEQIIKSKIDSIYQSENYQDFRDLGQKVQDIEVLKQILKLYSPYISKNEIERLYNDISILKFNVLWRSQVEQLIYANVKKDSKLMQYDSQEERKYFIEQLEKKINSLIIFDVESIENDEILRVLPDTILKNNDLLERLIIIDMKRHPYDYINLLKAKVFNAHLCNIANNPFKQEVNYSLLRAILKSIITDENISIIECENLYEKFGFQCRPIIINDGQRCIKMIYDRVKKSEEYERIREKREKRKVGKYCKIDFDGLIYDFDNDLKSNKNEYNVKELLNQRKVKIPSTVKRKRFSIRRGYINNEEETEQSKKEKFKEKVKSEGIITKDIDIIILLLQDIITKYKTKLSVLKEILEETSAKDKEFDLFLSEYDIKSYEREIERREDIIKELEQLKNKNGILTLEETKELLVIINDIYIQLNIKYNVWDLLPLENMGSKNSNKVYLAPVPTESWTEQVEVSHSFEYEDRYYHKSDLQPLWNKYQEEFGTLGIDVKKYSNDYGYEPRFEICVNLDDISDLPIDYDKVRIVTEEELQEIIKREEGDIR